MPGMEARVSQRATDKKLDAACSGMQLDSSPSTKPPRISSTAKPMPAAPPDQKPLLTTRGTFSGHAESCASHHCPVGPWMKDHTRCVRVYRYHHHGHRFSA